MSISYNKLEEVAYVHRVTVGDRFEPLRWFKLPQLFATTVERHQPSNSNRSRAVAGTPTKVAEDSLVKVADPQATGVVEGQK